MKTICFALMMVAGSAAWAADPPATQSTPVPETLAQSPATMTAVQAAVQKQIDQSLAVSSRVEVQVDERGVASLFGFVNSEAERDSAVKLASDTPGVSGVVEDLRVLPANLE